MDDIFISFIEFRCLFFLNHHDLPREIANRWPLQQHLLRVLGQRTPGANRITGSFLPPSQNEKPQVNVAGAIQSGYIAPIVAPGALSTRCNLEGERVPPTVSFVENDSNPVGGKIYGRGEPLCEDSDVNLRLSGSTPSPSRVSN